MFAPKGVCCYDVSDIDNISYANNKDNSVRKLLLIHKAHCPMWWMINLFYSFLVLSLCVMVVRMFATHD